MNGKKIFWGIFFILATVLLIVSQVGSFMEIGFWSLLGTIILLAVIIQSAIYRVWFGICISAAFLYMIYQEPLGWPDISFVVLIVAAVLLSIGLHFLLKPKKQHYRDSSHFCYMGSGDGWQEAKHSDNEDDNDPEMSVKFGNIVRYLHSSALRSGKLQCSFGNLEVYFDEAALAPEGAELFIECSFGDTKLYIPKHWSVEERLSKSLGDASFGGKRPEPDAGSRLVLTGNVSFGNVRINYV